VALEPGSPVTLNASGQATYTTSSLSVTNGTNHTVSTAYSGDTTFVPSSGSLSGGQEVDKAATTTQLANLSGANLIGANLSNANLSQTNLELATGMSTAALTGVIWSKTTCPDGTNSNKDGGTCIGHL
jgi:uncharacterized protein YjbI with pentapeptide repeats